MAYQIIEKKSKKVICDQFEKADNSIARMRGLMFRANPVSILFDFGAEGIYPIHSFFVRFDFDAIYLDAEFKVVEVFSSVKPYTAVVMPKNKARYLLETPPGVANKFAIKEGTELEIK